MLELDKSTSTHDGKPTKSKLANYMKTLNYSRAGLRHDDGSRWIPHIAVEKTRKFYHT